MAGFFDSIGELFTGADSGSFLLGIAALGGLNLYAADRTADANIRAAQIAAQGQYAAADAVREGNQAAQARYDALQAQTAPAQNYLRSVVASDPNTLTPAQQRAYDDISRTSNDNLAASGLRGAGRAQVAALRSIQNDTYGKFIEANRARSDAAARQLSSQYGGAVTGAANLDATTGRAAGTALATVGDINANATTANEGAFQSALGDTIGLIRSEAADRRRESRFKDAVAARTEPKPDSSLGSV